jgi:hypothetical protein
VPSRKYPSSIDDDDEKLPGNYWTRFQKGRAKTGGRKKGTKDKIPTEVARALHEAFEGIGGTEALIHYATDDPAGFYKLYAKMLPKSIKAELVASQPLIDAIRAGRKRVAAKKQADGQ